MLYCYGKNMGDTPDILKKIIQRKLEEITVCKQKVTQSELQARLVGADRTRGFANAIDAYYAHQLTTMDLKTEPFSYRDFGFSCSIPYGKLTCF